MLHTKEKPYQSDRLVIYLTTIDNNFISIPFIDLAIFSIQLVRLGRDVPTYQVPPTLEISSVNCTILKMLQKFKF